MKITLIHNISGTRNGVPWPERGGSVDLPDDEARALIALGMAVESDEPAAERPKPERRPTAKRAEKRDA